ncbi:MAG: radical SAM protein [Prevotella sp.]|nr:radical SAM protein [Prevotella sp.]
MKETLKAVKKQIDLEKRYCFPQNISVVNFKGRHIVISVDTLNWLVLENKKQLSVFQFLKNNSIRNTLKEFAENEYDVKFVITQVEAKDFENTDVTQVSKKRVQIHLTNNCNLRCPHCYMFSGHSRENELTTDELHKILSCLKKEGWNAVTFTGGEICMRKDFYDIIEYAKKEGYTIQLLTNGTMWTQKLISKISPLIDMIQISIDGFDEKENSKIRGKGNFAKALKTVDVFAKSGIQTEVAITPFFDDELIAYKENFSNFALDLLSKYDHRNFRIKFTADLLDGREIHFSAKQKKQYEKIMTDIYHLCYGEQIEDMSFIDAIKKKRLFNNCSYGNLCINSEGDVFLCGRLTLLKPIANIRKDSFSKIVEISKKAHYLSEINHFQPCRNCELKNICGGGCRITYFPEFTEKDVLTMDMKSISPRKCSKKNKEFYYDLMIRTNQKLFK